MTGRPSGLPIHELTKKVSTMIEVYSIPQCSQCEMAKKLLGMRDIAYEPKLLDQDYTMESLTEKHEGAAPRTFPQIFIDGVYLGGFQDLKMAIARGEVS